MKIRLAKNSKGEWQLGALWFDNGRRMVEDLGVLREDSSTKKASTADKDRIASKIDAIRASKKGASIQGKVN